jgi:hypothetical protein
MRPIIFICLTLAASTAQAQTSLRVNMLGPVPIIEQNLSPNWSVEFAYSPRVLGREIAKSIGGITSLGGVNVSDAQCSAGMLTLKYHLEEEIDFRTLYKTESFNYFLLSFKHTLDTRNEAYYRSSENFEGWSKREAYGCGLGFGKRTIYPGGFTLDFNTSIGIATIKRIRTGLYTDKYYGSPLTQREGTSVKTGLRPVFGYTISIGYTFLRK